MTYLSSLLLIISILQLIHSGFSSYEFHQFKKDAITLNGNQASSIKMPLDIQIEAMVGLFLFTISIFLSFQKLKYYPMQSNLKILTQNMFLQEINMNKATTVDNLIGNDPFGQIIYCPNFVNVHEKRRTVQEYLSKTIKA